MTGEVLAIVALGLWILAYVGWYFLPQGRKKMRAEREFTKFFDCHPKDKRGRAFVQQGVVVSWRLRIKRLTGWMTKSSSLVQTILTIMGLCVRGTRRPKQVPGQDLLQGI